MVIGQVVSHGIFELSQPRPHGQAALREPIFPDIDMHRFLDREGKARSAVIEDCRSDDETRFLMQDPIIDLTDADLFSCEGGVEAKPDCFGCEVGSDFGDREHEIAGIPVCKIPQIRLQLMLNMVGKPMRPIEAYSVSRPTSSRSNRSKPMK